MIRLSVPCIFDDSLIEYYQYFNEKYSNNNIEIYNLYGAIPGNHSAREKDRFPKINYKNFKQYFKMISNLGIKFSYTMNSTSFDYQYIKRVLAPFLKKIYDLGIDSLTISSPLLIEYINREMSGYNFNITLSTISNVDSVSKFQQAIELGCNNVVLSLKTNRNFQLLSSINKLSTKYNIKVQLIVNEFCGDCLIRPFHYNYESESNKIKINAKKQFFKDYPYSICESLWLNNAANILKSYWILPQWLEFYNLNMGVSYFKISGRTHFNSNWHKFVLKQYGEKYYAGNILKLSPHDDCANLFEVDSKFIEEIQYLNYFFKYKPNCSSLCGSKCKYCDINAEKLFYNNESSTY